MPEYATSIELRSDGYYEVRLNEGKIRNMIAVKDEAEARALAERWPKLWKIRHDTLDAS